MKNLIWCVCLCPAVALGADPKFDNARRDLLGETSALTACATERAALERVTERTAEGIAAYQALSACRNRAGAQASKAAGERIEAEQAASAEAARKAKQERLDALNAATERVLSDKKALAAIGSAVICDGQAARAKAMREIAEEKKYSRVGGAENLSRLYSLQSDVRAADEQMAAGRKYLAEKKVRAVPCTREDVAAILSCANAETFTKDCETAEMGARSQEFGSIGRE